ncbi:MAG TPA: GAF domain-containing protein [Cyclobacteriaceae bacterium]
MYNLINSLTVNSRLRVISILTLIFAFVCAFLLWNTSGSFDDDLIEINSLTDLDLKVWQIRNNYNSMRADIMQIFIADPKTQQEYIKEGSTLFRERIDQIKEYTEAIDKSRFNDETEKLYTNFNSSLQAFITFCLNNLSAIQAVQLDDSVEFNRIRNLLVVDMNKHFQMLRADAIKVIESVSKHEQAKFQAMDQRRKTNLWFTIIFSASLFALIIYVIMAISKSITSPIKETEQILQSLSSGEVPDVKEYKGRDEFSRMLRSLKLFNSHIHSLMDFVRNVSQNNFAVQAQMFEGRGPIAASLVSMRNNLQHAYTVESQRTWASKGIAELGELIRRQENSAELYDKALSFIVKYLEVNQGVLYIHNESTNALDLVAAYAYGRKKFIVASLNPGEGLAGQIFLEKEISILKNVPKEYIKITSGLGEASPRILVISPLINNDEVLGVLEVAGFNDLGDYKLEFIKKISEELAAIIKSTKVNTQTKELLLASQQQAEELKSQEEEMRQNMEELQATQEGMGRMLKDFQNKEVVFNEMLDAIQAPVLIFDNHYKVIQLNKSMKKSYSIAGLTIDVGTDLLNINPSDISEMKLYYDRALRGEIFQAQHNTIKIAASYSSIHNSTGDITAGVMICHEAGYNYRTQDDLPTLRAV